MKSAEIDAGDLVDESENPFIIGEGKTVEQENEELRERIKGLEDELVTHRIKK